MWTQTGAVSSFLHLQISPEKGWRGASVGLLALGDGAGLAPRRGVTWGLIWLAVQSWPGGRNRWLRRGNWCPLFSSSSRVTPPPPAPGRQLVTEPLGLLHQTWPASCLFLPSPREASVSEGMSRPHTSCVVLWLNTQQQLWMDRELWVSVECPHTHCTHHGRTGQTVGRGRKEQPVTPGWLSLSPSGSI